MGQGQFVNYNQKLEKQVLKFQVLEFQYLVLLLLYIEKKGTWISSGFINSRPLISLLILIEAADDAWAPRVSFDPHPISPTIKICEQADQLILITVFRKIPLWMFFIKKAPKLPLLEGSIKRNPLPGYVASRSSMIEINCKQLYLGLWFRISVFINNGVPGCTI